MRSTVGTVDEAALRAVRPLANGLDLAACFRGRALTQTALSTPSPQGSTEKRLTLILDGVGGQLRDRTTA